MDVTGDDDGEPAARTHHGWLHATARWTEAIRHAANGETIDVSQSYWAMWSWYSDIIEGRPLDQLGSFARTARVIRQRGLVRTADFISEGDVALRSANWRRARDVVAKELSEGQLKDEAARADHALVLEVLLDAFVVRDAVAKDLKRTFGVDGSRTFSAGSAEARGVVKSPRAFAVRYRRFKSYGSVKIVNTDLSTAVGAWRWMDLPASAASRRDALTRMALALHDGQPVLLGWHVDFDGFVADGENKGAFDYDTWKTAQEGDAEAAAGLQLTMLTDYQVPIETYDGETELVHASDALDPLHDADTIEMALHNVANFNFLRVDNAWGLLSDARTEAEGMPAQHDIAASYLMGSLDGVTPLGGFLLPPGYGK